MQVIEDVKLIDKEGLYAWKNQMTRGIQAAWEDFVCVLTERDALRIEYDRLKNNVEGLREAESKAYYEAVAEINQRMQRNLNALEGMTFELYLDNDALGRQLSVLADENAELNCLIDQRSVEHECEKSSLVGAIEDLQADLATSKEREMVLTDEHERLNGSLDADLEEIKRLQQDLAASQEREQEAEEKFEGHRDDGRGFAG
jgi:chromosome segregation ATPase